MDAIVVSGVEKKYQNGVRALAGLSLTVRAGEIFSLLGPNGAGKSTLIHILTGRLPYTSGSVRIFGREICKERDVLRKKTACVHQQISLDDCLSVEENLLFHGYLYKIPKTEVKRRTEWLLEEFGLYRYRTYPAAACSGGVKRKLDIALRMMTEPEILFLDEPTVGLDEKSRTELWAMIRKMREKLGTCVFLTTHYLEEAERLSDRICIMKRGKEVVQGTPRDLKAVYGLQAERNEAEGMLEDIFLRLTEEGEG